MGATIKTLREQAVESNKISLGIIDNFSQYLTEKGLVKKTIRNHVYNIEFLLESLNRYADSKDDIKLISQADSGDLSYFSSSFFPRKATWASSNAAKKNIASFKKFFSWLYGTNQIDKDDYQDIIDTIKEETSYWIESAGYEDDDSWGWG